jgi:hypothetical protein
MSINKKEQINISIYTHCILLALSSILIFLLFGKHTAFEWTTKVDIPFIVRLVDPNFLHNDFYTNSQAEVGSVRFIFPNIIYGFTKLGVDWYSVLYFFKVAYVVIIKPLLFLVLYNIWLRWKPRDFSCNNNEIIKILLLLFCFSGHQQLDGFGWSYIQRIFDSFGWFSIQRIDHISPMSLSLVLGLIYNLVSFNQKNLQYFSPFLLLLSVLIHPIVGLFHFLISIIFLLPISINVKTAFKLSFDFLIGIMPAVLLFIYYKGNSSIDAITYINIYVYLRHPHHYLMSGAVSGYSVLLILIFIVPLYYSFKVKDKKYFILSLLIFMSIFLGPLIQFLGTEIWKIKIVAEIGLSRYSSFASILWMLNIIIIGSVFFKTTNMNKNRLLKNRLFVFLFLPIKNILLIFKIIFFRSTVFFQALLFKISLRIAFFFITVSLLVIFSITNKHPLEYYGNESKSLINWISKNTPRDSVFFVRHREFDSFLIRIYGERAVFSDVTFPFNDNYIEEFKDRYLIYRKSDKFNSSDYACVKNHFDIRYLVVPSKMSFDNFSALYSSTEWAIYDISEFNVNTRFGCNIKQLSTE